MGMHNDGGYQGRLAAGGAPSAARVPVHQGGVEMRPGEDRVRGWDIECSRPQAVQDASVPPPPLRTK
eukprot:scaffold16691_cov74-Phaeocystis_antarctica.AAC.8